MNVRSPSIIAAQGVFIGNRWSPAASGKTLQTMAPAEGVPFAEIAAGDKPDVDRAVKAAQAALAGAWGRMSATERGRLLTKLGYAVQDHAEELAQLEARDTGKPMKQARNDMIALARYFEYYGGAADKVHGDTMPFLPGYFVMTEHVAHGVVGHIIPWNYPAQMFGRTVAPALAMGNASVIKPAEDACLTPLRIAALAADVGFPEGAINVVPGLGEAAGAALSSHPEIDFISFTGSPEVGTLIQSAAARNHIGCTMELGGKSPHVLFADADLDTAIPVIANTMVQNAGQTCSAGSRLLIERGIYDEATGRLAEAFASLRAGTPEMDLDLGPVINATQKKRIEKFFDRAEEDGVPVAVARQRRRGRAGGCLFRRAPSLRPRAARQRPRREGDLRAGAFGAALRRRGRRGEARQRYRLRPDGRGLVARRQPGAARVARHPGRPSLHQQLRGRRRHRAALRRHEEVRPRPREGVRRAPRYVDAAHDDLQARVIGRGRRGRGPRAGDRPGVRHRGGWRRRGGIWNEPGTSARSSRGFDRSAIGCSGSDRGRPRAPDVSR